MSKEGRIALALKYRPNRLFDLVGQPQVSETMSRLLVLYRAGEVMMPPGFLFSGPRGTGKTSTARIIGAALNCEAIVPDGSVEPCGICPTCRSVFTTSSMSVLEIDAASHGLVEDTRKLQDLGLYQHPGRYRIIILDECHSMSPQAFNALLRQLEEPPPELMYILVTTEPGKVPDTVISRLVPFEFRRLMAQDVQERLAFVCEQEGIEFEELALVDIARASRGGMRDALMMVDHAFWRKGAILTEDIQKFLGVGRQDIVDLVTACERGDVESGMVLVDRAFARSLDPYLLIDEWTEYLRDVLLRGRGLEVEGVDEAHYAIPEVRVFECFRVLWDLRKAAVAAPASEALVKLAFMLLVPQGVRGSGMLAMKPEAIQDQVVTVDELRRMFG